MKKILSFIIFATLIAGATGCSDYLDLKRRGDGVPSTLAHYEWLIYGTDKSVLFNYYHGTFEYTIDADGYLAFYDTSSGYNGTKAYTWQPDIYRQDDNCYEWNTPCSIFYTFNMIVDQVMDAED